MTPADLKAARSALGITQRRLADLLGVPQSTVWRWESGAVPIERPRMLRLALERLACISEVSHAPPGSPPVGLEPPDCPMRSD